MFWIKTKSTSLTYKIVIFLCSAFFKLVYRHQVFGLEHFISGGAIIAANHISFYDPPLMAISAPEEIHLLARKSLFDSKLFGGLISKLNAHPISGGARDVSVLRVMLKLLKAGKKVLLFPEGTRTEGELGEIKEGLGLLAQKSGCPIIPAYIFGVKNIWPRAKKLPKFFGKTAVIFGPVIDPKDFAHLERKEAQSAIAKSFAKCLTELAAKRPAQLK